MWWFVSRWRRPNCCDSWCQGICTQQLELVRWFLLWNVLLYIYCHWYTWILYGIIFVVPGFFVTVNKTCQLNWSSSSLLNPARFGLGCNISVGIWCAYIRDFAVYVSNASEVIQNNTFNGLIQSQFTHTTMHVAASFYIPRESILTFNMLNCLKHYTRYVHILHRIQELVWPKWLNSGTIIHVRYPIQPIPCLLMFWRLQEPWHQQAWYWPQGRNILSLASEELITQITWD